MISNCMDAIMRVFKRHLCFFLMVLSSTVIMAQVDNHKAKIISPPTAKAEARGKPTMNGVLKVHATNPRYFTDKSGRAIYLTGSHTWLSVLDGVGPSQKQLPEDNGFLDFISAHGH